MSKKDLDSELQKKIVENLQDGQMSHHKLCKVIGVERHVLTQAIQELRKEGIVRNTIDREYKIDENKE